MHAWNVLLKQLEYKLGKDTVDKWLRTLNIIKFDACNIYLEAQNTFQITWFNEHIKPIISKELVNNNGTLIKVHLNVKNNKTTFKSKKNKFDEPPQIQINQDTVNPYYTINHFVNTKENNIVFSLISELIGYDNEDNSFSNPKMQLGTFNPIFLYGPSGCGKTHVLSACYHTLKDIGYKVFFIHAKTFASHVVEAIRKGSMQQFRKIYRDIDVLIVDDIHILSNKSATQEEFFHTFNTLHNKGSQILISANMSPKKLEAIEPRLISRFEWGISLPLSCLDKDNIKTMALMQINDFDLKLSKNAIDFLLQSFRYNAKSVKKALHALAFRISHANEIIDDKTIEITLNDLIEEEKDNILSYDKIISIVSDHFGIRPNDILGKSQTRECALPRQISIFYLRELLKMPFLKIAQIFNRDHSTIMSSVKTIKKAVNNKDIKITNDLLEISKKLEN